ncbi:MAG: beta-lactamase family protein [Odoribacter sp.]|nr:beta-lactamase family protein [Odoribacter sp.]
MSRKKMRVILLTLLVLFIIIALFPTYIRQALIHWYPDITDTYIFPSNVISKSSDCWDWSAAKDYNQYVLSREDSEFIEEYQTVAYLVIQNDSVLYEEYRDKWESTDLSNIFSATKSIVGLLTGIAYDEGYIESLDDKVSKYLPEFEELGRENITIRNLLTMSSGLDWDEAYSSLFSKTTEAYYGDDIRSLVMGLKSVEPAGERFSYKSGDTQILSFIIEAALRKKNKERYSGIW